MAAPTTTTDLLDLIRESGLIDADTLARLGTDLPPDPIACAEKLVGAEVLTAFQAKQALVGRVRGLVLGQYRVLRPLGKGGMGIVYLAEHVGLGRQVAVKVLNEEQAREKLGLERFFREARAAAALDHLNIVRLHDITQADGVHFLVMEYVDGIDLQALIDQTGPLLCSRAANYIAQAAAGLQHAHDKGFVHRDIKPANLILAKDGTVKVLDMGLARSVCNPKDSLTGTLNEEVIVGTADYLSPEQALNADLDARSDIYSLGATFFALLTGRAPYQGSLAQKVAQHQLAATPDVSKTRADVPPQLAAVITRMMAKLPRDRYQSVHEVIAAVTPWLPDDMPSGVTLSLRTADTTSVGIRRKESGAPPARTRLERVLRSRMAGIAVGCAMIVLSAGLLDSVFGGPKPATTQIVGGEPSPQPPTANDLQVLTGHTAAVNDLVISPDETRLASIDWSGKVLIWDVRTGQRLHELQTRPGARGLTCTTTPDGRLLLVGGERMPILAFEWETGREVHEYPPHEKATWGLAVSPSGQHLLSCGGDGAVVLRELATGDEVRRFELTATLVWTVMFSPDGTKFAAGTGAGPTPEESSLVVVWSTADGKELHRMTGHTWDVRTVGFRPDGQVLASGGFDGTVRLWNLNTGTEIRSIAAHDGIVERVFFLPEGGLLTCGGPMQNVQPTGEGGAVKIWDTDTGREIKGWRGTEWTDLISLMPSRSGRFAAAGGRERNVQTWSLPGAPAFRADRLIHTFDLSRVTPFRSVHQDGGHVGAAWASQSAPGVCLHCWRKESVAEFRGDAADGRPWVGVTNLNTDVSSQILFQFDDGLDLPLVAGRPYRVRMEYRTSNEAFGFVSVRNPKDGDYSGIADARLEKTDGAWKTIELTFRRPTGGKIDVCVVNNATGEGNLLAVRLLEVFEVDPERENAKGKK